LLAAGGTKGPQMQRVEWDLGEWIGRTVILRIVDRNQGGWGHLTFDDFSVEGELVE
jgi:fructan beta-fructosidase